MRGLAINDFFCYLLDPSLESLPYEDEDVLGELSDDLGP